MDLVGLLYLPGSIDEFLLDPLKTIRSIRNQLAQNVEPNRYSWTVLQILQYMVQHGFVKPTTALELTVGLTESHLKQQEVQVAQRLAWYLTKEDWDVDDAVNIITEGWEGCLRRYQILDPVSLRMIGWSKGYEVKVLASTPQLQPPPMPIILCDPACGVSTNMKRAWASPDGESLLQAALSWAKTTLKWNQSLIAAPKPFRCISALSLLNSPYIVHQDLSPDLHRVMPVRQPKTITLGQQTWDGLEAITFDQLEWPKRHAGNSVLVRIISSPLISTGISLTVEDRRGQAMVLYIAFPFRKPAFRLSQTIIDIRFPLGAALLIRDPHVLFGAHTGQPELHVNVMQELRMLPWTDVPHWGKPDPGGLSRLRACGEVFETLGQDLLVAHFLALALEIKPDATTQLKRAEALFRLERFGEASRLLTSIKSETLTDSGQFQQADLRARTELRRHCFGYLSPGVITDPQQRSESAPQQHERGHYDWTSMRDHKTSVVADFIGQVTVRKVKGKGRGLFTTRAVKAGEILLVEKALASAGPEDLGNYDVVGVYMKDNGDPRVVDGVTSSLVLLHKAINAIADDPSLYLAWQGLCPRPTRPTPLSTEQERLEALDGAIVVDWSEMYDKLKYNAWTTSTQPDTPHWHSRSGCEGHEYLFKTISMINHSCMPTAYSTLLGDVMVVRAISVVPAGSEITIAYCAAPWEPYGARQEATARWGFACACLLCEMDRVEDHKARRAIIEAIDTVPEPAEEDPTRIGTVGTLQMVYDTYGPVRTVMPEMATLLLSAPEDIEDKQPFIDGLSAAGCIIGSPSYRKRTGLALEHVSVLVHYKMLIRACRSIAMRVTDHEEARAWRQSAFFIYDLEWGPNAPVEAFEQQFWLGE